MDRAAEIFSQRRSRIALIGLLVMLAISGAAGFRYVLRPGHAAKSGNIGRLARIVGSHRLTRARLSGGFSYARCPIDSSSGRLVRGLVCSGPPLASWSSAEQLNGFAGEMRLGGEGGSAMPDAHTIGIWRLVLGRTEDAVRDLRAAVKREPSNARALNDLAVALTSLAQANDDPSMLVDAFVAADSAVRMDSTLKEAQFTHAVLLEQLYLRTDAIEAWNRYLKHDRKPRSRRARRRSSWMAEAREHLAALQSQGDKTKRDQERLRRAIAVSDSQALRSIVADSPSDVRAVMEAEVGKWGAAFVSRDPAGAGKHLDLARALVGPFRSVTGDALLGDAIATIDQALATRDTARSRTLAEGHLALTKGIERFDSANFVTARPELLKAHRLLAAARSPMTGWALLYFARTQTSKQPDSAWTLLTGIRDSAAPSYLALRSAAAQYHGFLSDVRSDYVHLMASYDSAVAENRSTREPWISMRVGSWLARAEDVLRGKEAGWRTRYAALAESPRYPTVYRSLYSVFDYAGLATANDAPRLSLRYANEAIRVARLLPDSASLTYALRRRGELLAKLGQTGQARADIDAALNAAKWVADTGTRRRLIAEVSLAHANIALRSTPAEAGAELRGVVDHFTATKYEKGLPRAYLSLAQSRAAAGAIDSARAAFDSATSLMQRQRATVTDYAERTAFLDDARSVIDQIVAFDADHSAKDAFEFFEANRSRALLEQLAESSGQSTNQRDVLGALQRSLTKNDVVLSYAVLPRELLVWIITRSRFEQHRVSVTAPDLEELVNRFQQSLLDASGQPDSGVSERLYRTLRVDSASRLQPGANLIVIPDRWLHFVPFVALRDPSTDRFLLRDHAVTYAPSATLLASSLGRPPQRFSQSSKVLAVGNPAFDRRAFHLPPLPAADGEARRIASLYTDQSPLTGREATDAALERMAPAFDILHFAGHAVVGRDAPQLSHLVLASEGGSDGAVFAPEIAKWKLPRTRLVVLSGCNTADGKLSATEGASSLARAFFTAGVPSVLSSLWAIEDDDTADFFIAFHRRLVEGVPPAVALRETQIKWLGDGRVSAHPVRSWAAFQLFGR